MMQSKGNQRTLQQAVNKGACVAGSQHQCTLRGNTALHHRPDIEHGNADQQIHNRTDDGHKAGAAEEGKHLRQLDLIELVVQRRHAQTGAVAYIIMNTAIQAMINAAGGVDAMPANSTTTMLGITTLQMGVFGGIVVGLGVAALHNKFYKIELPR